MRDAFYQLVLFPTKACAIVNDLYVTAGKNDLYAKQGRASANDMAARTRLLFETDTAMMGYYNRDFADGKWSHFMDQSHLGYTSWADPPVNSLRAIKLTETEVPEAAMMGVSVDGSDAVWPGETGNPELPEFDIFNKQSHYIDIFNKGKNPFEFKAIAEEQWIILNEITGTIEKDKRINVTIDWNKAPKGKSLGKIRISGTGNEVTVLIKAFNPEAVTPSTLTGFIESEGYVSIEAEHFTKQTAVGQSSWVRIEDYGHTLSAMRANTPVDAPPATPGKNSPSLEYKIYMFSTGTFEITSIFSPTLNFLEDRAMRYAISIDNEPPQIITLVPGNYNAQNRNADWEKSVRDNARFSLTNHTINSPGYHTLKIYMALSRILWPG
jgi:hypothetical protein